MALSSWLFPCYTTRWEDGENGAHAMFLPLLFFDAACSDFPAWLRFRSLFNAANSRSRMSEASPRVSVSHRAMPKRLSQEACLPNGSTARLLHPALRSTSTTLFSSEA